jgi:glycine betaine/choline ABC-type transport system substrate-binding protein
MKTLIRKSWTLRAGSAMCAAALLLGSFGCSPEGSTPTITIGSKNFTEQLIIAEMMAQMIEEHTDLRVKQRANLGGTMICHSALTGGDLDLYAEYTGTALTAILKRSVITDPDEAYQVVQGAYQKQFNCTWLEPFGFNNTYTLAVRRAFVQETGKRKISDLKGAADDLEAGFTAEFAVREDGYPGLKAAYGFAFGNTRDMDPGLMYEAIVKKQVDVICAFATDGRIAAYDLAVLEDDKQFFPPYYAAPVVSNEVLKKHPEIREALAPLAGLLDDQAMQELNFRVDEKKVEPRIVARDFLRSKGLIPEAKTN